MAGLPPEQPSLEGAGRIDGVLPGERRMRLRHRPLPEPGQRDLPLGLLALGEHSRVGVTATGT